MKKAGIIAGAAAGALALAGGLMYTMTYGTADGQETAAQTEQSAQVQETEASAGESTQETNIQRVSVSLEDAVQITLEEGEISLSGSGASVSGNTVTISSGGTYRVSGELEDGQICVDADGDATVTLVLDGVELANESEPAVYVENAGSTILYLAEGSQNKISSGADTGTSAAEGEADASAEGGAIYARDDLTIAGDGALEVTGWLNNGIQTSNNLVIESGSIVVDAVNNAIKGKDSVTIIGGEISVSSGGDGIKSDDATGEGYGIVRITDGALQIESGGDGIQAETICSISSGEIRIVSGGGSADADTVADDFGFGMGGFQENWDMEDEDAQSTKGIKSGSELQLSGGTISVDSYDDALHSNGSITISGGSFTAATGDDGIHADTQLTITDGSMDITQSYEGLEGNQIRISGGEIQISATDDGINAYGGSGGWGGSANTTEETPLLLITGGTIRIDAQGDGLDSNGDLTVEGGTITVDGPSDSANGAIDSGTENGGVCTISGGTILAIGASGMAETFDDSSAQCALMYSFSTNYEAGSVITISDEDGNLLFEHEAARSFSSLVFSSPELEEGAVCRISVDGETTEITLTSVSGSYSAQGQSNGPGMNNGGFSGRRRGG